MVAAAVAAVGAGASMYASSKSAKAQKNAANQAASNEQAMFEAQREDNQKYYDQGRGDVNANFGLATGALSPYANQGAAATSRLSALAGLGGSEQQQSALASDPGYQFRMSQGVNALDRSAAARGMINSGAQQKALTGYGQGLASSELNNAFQRIGAVQGNAQQAAGALGNLYQNQGTTLGNMAVHQGSQNQALAQNTSNALGQYTMNAGNARAGAYENMGSSVNAGMQNGLTAYMMQQQQRGGMYGGGTSPGPNGQTINWYNRG
jgi:hypothetical protein